MAQAVYALLFWVLPYGGEDGAAWFVQVGAVVEAAIACVGAYVGHEGGELGGADVVQAKFWKARCVDDGCAAGFVEPVPEGVCGGVFARVEGLGDFACLCACIW